VRGNTVNEEGSTYFKRGDAEDHKKERFDVIQANPNISPNVNITFHITKHTIIISP
jgi:hypothetical protein